MDKDTLKGWLTTEGKDRHWLATQLGVSKGTVDQWFSRGFPEWAIKSIERITNPADAKPGGNLEVTFSAEEFERIEAARKLLGIPTRKLFYEEAIDEYTTQILERQASALDTREITTDSHLALVAETPASYHTGGSHGDHDPVTHDHRPLRHAADEQSDG